MGGGGYPLPSLSPGSPKREETKNYPSSLGPDDTREKIARGGTKNCYRVGTIIARVGTKNCESGTIIARVGTRSSESGTIIANRNSEIGQELL